MHGALCTERRSIMADEWYEGASFNRISTFRFGDCDPQKNATLYSLMKLLSELACDDYEGRGLGHAVLKKRSQAMLVSRLALQIERMPVYGERVIASTWERMIKGPFFYREYEIRKEDGQLLVSGSSLWTLVDPEVREILRPARLVGGNRELDPRKSACPDCRRLKKRDDLTPLGERPVYWSDLDANGHVTNAVYGRIATDFLPEQLRGRTLHSFTINFNLEVHPNETLQILGAESSEDSYFEQGVTGNDTHYLCEFKF
jgi:medium-chain acyl-[acyl-carrier-protein] hydrolase